MGLLTNLFRLIGPTFPSGFCPKSYQELSDAIINGTQLTFLIDTGNFLYNYGSSTPAPENRIFPWLNTDDGLWYNFKFGLWVTPISPRDAVNGFRQMYLPAQGTPISTVWSLDSGDGTDGQPTLPDGSPNPSYVVPTATTGAMWIVDYTMNGRFPLGSGIIPNSDLGSGDASVGIAQTGDSFGREGEYAHELTDAEGATGQHIHPFGRYDSGAANFGFKPNTTVPVYTATVVQGINTGTAPDTVANLFTLPTNDGNGVTPTKFNEMPPYIGVWWLKHTARRYYTRPA